MPRIHAAVNITWGVRYAVMKLQGKPIPKRVDTGVTVVTKRNFSKPAIQKLLSPLKSDE